MIQTKRGNERGMYTVAVSMPPPGRGLGVGTGLSLSPPPELRKAHLHQLTSSLSPVLIARETPLVEGRLCVCVTSSHYYDWFERAVLGLSHNKWKSFDIYIIFKSHNNF